MDFNHQDSNQPLTVGQFQEHVETLTKVVATKLDVHELGQQLREEMSEKFDKVLNSVDAMAKNVQAIRDEQIMKVGRDDRQDHDITSLKARVIGVERRVGIEPV
ncbi:MAG: hypothetical protein HYT31_01190 [Parcubacteria group bacterium]|nr:hypothetical protein [Parcubacteria group bacterium]